MEFKDYYNTLGVARDASADEIKRAYRKLARKFHPDVSKEPDAEVRFKEVGEAYEVLKDEEKRATYDAVGQRGSAGSAGEEFRPPPGWDSGFEFHGSGNGADDFSFHDRSDFFEALFGRAPRGAQRGPQAKLRGEDHHARIQIDLEDAFNGAERSLSLRMPAFDGQGRGVLQERTLHVAIPKGIREGQQLRLAGQGGPGFGGGPAGDLFLDVAFKPHPRYRVDGRDVYMDLPVAPWEAALGAAVPLRTPAGATLELSVPAGSAAGRRLRLKGRGIPGDPAGDLYALLAIALPPADSAAARAAYEALQAAAGAQFNPRGTP